MRAHAAALILLVSTACSVLPNNFDFDPSDIFVTALGVALAPENCEMLNVVKSAEPFV
jgi:hypothetical protein